MHTLTTQQKLDNVNEQIENIERKISNLRKQKTDLQRKKKTFEERLHQEKEDSHSTVKTANGEEELDQMFGISSEEGNSDSKEFGTSHNFS
jgi:predicted  nucleic acid-binding Zn-ribbon protein